MDWYRLGERVIISNQHVQHVQEQYTVLLHKISFISLLSKYHNATQA